MSWPIKHGMARTKIYSVWRDMRQRCHNAKHRQFKHYGGRGITICKRWDDFANFVADMGPRPLRTTLDRINNDGDYKPSNCRWATYSQQNSNTRSTKWLTHAGLTLTQKDWAKRLGVSETCIRHRLKKLGMSVAEALTKKHRTKPEDAENRP